MIATLKAWLARLGRAINPHPRTWRGMARALHLVAWLLLVAFAATLLVQAPSWYNALAILVMIVLVLAAVGVVVLIVALLARLAPSQTWALALFVAVTVAPSAFLGAGVFALLAAVFASVLLCGAGWANYRRKGLHWSAWTPAAIGALGVVGVAVAGLIDGWPVQENLHWAPMSSGQLELADPSLPGPRAVKTFTYGPGNDARGGQYGDNVRYRTEPVDGSKLLDGWEGNAGWARSGYWRAGPDRLPLRGMVWMPEGEGPFPLVLIVHGNHQMEDVSDDGYGYLGELFASRGAITVSVDENFLNSSTSSMLSLFDGGLEEENDARGWLLLEHLRQWRDWSADPSHELHRRADLDRVVLIGHSRGGEAVSEAALFNELAAYPDDATLRFDYRFGLRGVIAIAPVDHQYMPRERDTRMRGVSYLVIHGSHDSDVTSYAGYGSYARLDFAACASCFKAGVYLLGANHGQFNTGWGRYDVPAPFSRLLNTAPLMDASVQRQVAQVLFSAFLQTVLHDDASYRPFLAAPERAAGLLPPEAAWLSHYRAAGDVLLADFEEDADVATAAHSALRLSGEGLALWREAEVGLKWRTAGTAMVSLGWDRGDDEDPPGYELAGLDGLDAALTPDTALAFALSMSTAAPGELDDYEPPEAIDFSLELIDRHGAVGRLALSARRALLPQVEPVLYKHASLNRDAPSEVVLQRYRFTLNEFAEANPELDLGALAALRFVFDRTPRGSVWLDDLVLSVSGD